MSQFLGSKAAVGFNPPMRRQAVPGEALPTAAKYGPTGVEEAKAERAKKADIESDVELIAKITYTLATHRDRQEALQALSALTARVEQKT